jgi:hypothetical protein
VPSKSPTEIDTASSQDSVVEWNWQRFCFINDERDTKGSKEMAACQTILKGNASQCFFPTAGAQQLRDRIAWSLCTILLPHCSPPDYASRSVFVHDYLFRLATNRSFFILKIDGA